MTDPARQPISYANGLETHVQLDARLAQDSAGKANNTIHGIPPFTVPRADGTLEASPDIRANVPHTATVRMMRRRQNEALRSDQDGDGNYTNHQGYRDGQNDNDGDGSGENLPGRGDHSSSNHGHQHGLSGKLKAGVATRRPFLQRLRKAAMPTLFGALIGWYYDAVDVLVYRNDPRIKGTLLTFSLLCLLTMLSIFFYLEFIRPIIRGKRTEYVNWEKELLYPVRIATASLVLGSIGSNIALWPVWHLSTVFVLTVLAVAIVNVLGIFF